MMLFRLLNIQGIAGLAMSVALATLLVVQKGETRHWKKESGRFELLYRQQQSALATTVSNYRAAARQAQAADAANSRRVQADQRAINERTEHDFEARLAASRSLAQRLRRQSARAAADPRGGAGAPVPGVPAPAGGPAATAAQDRLPDADAELATEQAIQLDELIRWVQSQHSVEPNEAGGARPQALGQQHAVDPNRQEK
jgi:CRP-like cAMP-binding protein